MNRHFAKGSRTKGVAIVMIIMMATFVVRLFYIQVVQHDYYVEQADSEQMKKFTLHAQRGEIYTMDGDTPTKLVMNETVYTVWADPTEVEDVDKVVEVLNRVAGGNVRDNFKQYLTKKDTRYQVLARKVTRTQAELIKKEDLAGIGFDAVSQRVYPEGSLAAQVLGFVDTDGNGKYGFEQANDTTLKGTDGMLNTVTDVRSVPLTVGDKNVKVPAKNGTNYVLTIDRNVQAEAEQALSDGMSKVGATQGSVLVMDPNTGKILAMANLPSYDPSNLSSVTDLSVLNNNIISTPYEPASVMKTVAMSAGVDKGAMTPDSTYVNTDSITIDDTTIQNATKGQTGTITMQHALNWSLNTGSVTLATWLGGGSINRTARDILYTYYHDKFRLGEKTGIELANEQAGTVIPPSDPQGNAVRYANMTFGQGLDVTTLQVASAFSAVINGGVYHQPTVVDGTMSDDGTTFTAAKAKSGTQIIKQSTSATMKQMIYDARHAFPSYYSSDRSGYYVGGKTGTAQTIENGKYVFDQTIATYVGFGGEVGQNSSYVIMVELYGPHKNLDGGHHALPIFTDISNWMIDYLKLTPQG
jgi:cell division protein FtsI/penicillin-binding protein 2